MTTMMPIQVLSTTGTITKTNSRIFNLMLFTNRTSSVRFTNPTNVAHSITFINSPKHTLTPQTTNSLNHTSSHIIIIITHPGRAVRVGASWDVLTSVDGKGRYWLVGSAFAEKAVEKKPKNELDETVVNAPSMHVCLLVYELFDLSFIYC